jgi:hypothetical protein
MNHPVPQALCLGSIERGGFEGRCGGSARALIAARSRTMGPRHKGGERDMKAISSRE